MGKPEGQAGGGLRRTAYHAVLAIMGAAWVAGCSSVLDAVNPVEWYRGAKGAIQGDADALAEAEPPPGSDEPFPHLSTVPERPRTMTAAERQEAIAGLKADRASARYTDEAPSRGPAFGPGGAVAMPVETPSAVAMPPASTAAGAPEDGFAHTATPDSSTDPSTPDASAARASGPSGPDLAASVGGDAGEGDTVGSVYRSRLEESAPTTTTRTVGPTDGARVGAPVLPGADDLLPPAGTTEAQASPAESSPDRADLAVGPVHLATIYFAHGASGLNAADRDVLRQVVRIYRERGGVLRVVGHASQRTDTMDGVRHKLINFQTSVARASAVARELIRLGADPGDVATVARSAEEPVYYEFMPSGEAGNRRAEVFLDF